MPVFRLTDDILFPSPELAEDDGLLALGGDLSQDRLLLAYRMGIFPWYSDPQPVLWWSPDPRMVLFPRQFHYSRSLRRVLKRGEFQVTMDTAFTEVIQACAEMRYPGREGTWITPAMLEAYRALHDAGYAHSVECRHEGELAGGLYGISLGRCFFGESMFSARSNGSKVALAWLVAHALVWEFAFIDAQVSSEHLLSLGARDIPRAEFLRLLAKHVNAPSRAGAWRPEVDPIEILDAACR